MPLWLRCLLLSEWLLEWNTIPHHCLLIALCLALPVRLGLLLCLCSKLVLVVSVASVVIVVLVCIVPTGGGGIWSLPKKGIGWLPGRCWWHLECSKSLLVIVVGVVVGIIVGIVVVVTPASVSSQSLMLLLVAHCLLLQLVHHC